MDGFNSASRPAQNWIGTLTERCEPVPDKIGLNPFSYFAPGWEYGFTHTWDSLGFYEVLFSRHLPSSECRVVPTGFSLGANIVLLGAELASQQPGIHIPAVILVAPVHEPSASLLDEYESLTSQQQRPGRPSSVPDRVPVPILELCGRDPHWRNRIRQAYVTLTSRGIEIHVVHATSDVFANYVPPPLPAPLRSRLHTYPISPVARGNKPLPPSTPEDSVDYHVEVRVAKETFDTVCRVLSQVLL